MLAASARDVFLWVGSVAGFISLALGIWLSLRALGVLNRPRYTIQARYLPPRDFVGMQAMAHFVVEYENDGNVPVTFSNFELLLPRANIVQGETVVAHPGARLYIDKRPSSRLGGIQEFEAIDYRTNKVELPPGSSHTDYFDLGALLPDGWATEPMEPASGLSDFHPVLRFEDSFGDAIYVDEHGVHAGCYVHPDRSALVKAGMKFIPPPTLTSKRVWRWFRRTWKHDLS